MSGPDETVAFGGGGLRTLSFGKCTTGRMVCGLASLGGDLYCVPWASASGGLFGEGSFGGGSFGCEFQYSSIRN